MPVLDQENKELHLKIVFCGPYLAGKGTNLAHIFQSVSPDKRSASISWSQGGPSFQFTATAKALPAGFRLRLHLQIIETNSLEQEFIRKVQEHRADGLVMVLDNRPPASFPRDDYSLARLGNFLTTDDWSSFVSSLPFVLQLNKRDEPDARSVASLREQILLGALATKPHIEAVARRGVGVMESLRAVIAQIFDKLTQSPANFFLKLSPEFTLEPPPPERLRSPKPTQTFSLVGDPAVLKALSNRGDFMESETRFLSFQIPAHPIHNNNRPSQGVFLCMRVGAPLLLKIRLRLLWARCLGAEQAVIWIDTGDTKDPEVIDEFESTLRDLLTQCRFLGNETPVLRSDSAPDPAAALLSLLDSLRMPTPWEGVRPLLFLQRRPMTIMARVLRGVVSVGDQLVLLSSEGPQNVTLTRLITTVRGERSVAAGGVVSVGIEGATLEAIKGGILLAAPWSLPLTSTLTVIVSYLFITLADNTPGTLLVLGPDSPPRDLTGLLSPLVEPSLEVHLVYGEAVVKARLLSTLEPLFEGQEPRLQLSLKTALPLCPGLEVTFYRHEPPALYGVATIA